MWKLELDENYFRIYDSKKMIAGYFDPDFGNNISKEHSEEIISSMLKNHIPISGGLIMVPLVKFQLFDTDLNTSLSNVEQNVIRVTSHIQKWKTFLSENNFERHIVRISHTDQDMLTITFDIAFIDSIPLEKNRLRDALSPVLDLLQTSGLL